jgi:hypothetical protein
MKWFYSLALAFFSLNAVAELPSFSLTSTGVPPIIVTVDSTPVETMYKRALNWVQEYYRNPDQVLRSKIDNDKIRIEGFNSRAFYRIFKAKTFYQSSYTLEIEFKPGKYRMTYTPGSILTDDNSPVYFTWSDLLTEKDRNGNSYKDALASFVAGLNELNQSFYDYVTGKKKDEW